MNETNESEENKIDPSIQVYHNSLHPDSITTQAIIDAFNDENLMPNFNSFREDNNSILAKTSSGKSVVIAGKAIINIPYETKQGQQTKEKEIIVVAQNGSLLTPESLIFSREMYQKAQDECLDLLLLTNTLGGDVMEHAALMGQSDQVSRNITKLLNLKSNIASLVVRIGGSGGGLCNQVADYSLMMQNAIYPVISPAHCKSILWSKDASKTADTAVSLLKPTPEQLVKVGIIDEVIEEYMNASHLEKPSGYMQTLLNINNSLIQTFKASDKNNNLEKLVKERIQNSRNGFTQLTASASFSGFAKKYFPGVDSFVSKTKEDTLGKTYKQLNGIGSGDLCNILRSERIKKEIKKQGANEETPMIHCGEQSRDGKSGIVVEVDEEALGLLERRYPLEKMNFTEYTIKRAEILEKSNSKFCSAVFRKDVFENNAYACPECGKGKILSGMEWIWQFVDSNSEFQELNSNLEVKDFKNTIYHTDSYLEEIIVAQEKSKNKSALITGVGKINGMEAMLCALDFSFMGGTLGGIVEPKKFDDAAKYAVKHKIPLVFISSSGGARMQEGTLALKAMQGTNASIQYMKNNNVPYFVVLANPTFGGTPASLGSRGDITLAEQGLRYGFTGPRVIQLALEPYISSKEQLNEKMKSLDFMMHPDIIKNIQTSLGRHLIDYVGRRNELKGELSKYLAITSGKSRD